MTGRTDINPADVEVLRISGDGFFICTAHNVAYERAAEAAATSILVVAGIWDGTGICDSEKCMAIALDHFQLDGPHLDDELRSRITGGC